MNVVVAFPSTAIFGQQAALAFHEAGQLVRFETAFTWNEETVLARVLRNLPANVQRKVLPQLRRRALTALPKNKVREDPFWEILRTVAAQAGASPIWVDRIWDRLSHDFTRGVGHRIRHNVSALYAYEYTALEAFRIARDRGIRTILDYPSLDSREFERQQDEEKSRFPELKGPHEDYFKTKFEMRQNRRDSERALADLIITNSSVTRASHVAAGAPADRTIAVPYGAPPALDAIAQKSVHTPLKLIWAGTFSIRKGAHYLVDALRMLGSTRHFQVDVYGAVVVPERAYSPKPSSLQFHGSVPRDQLFAAFDTSDALIFPTLSDGFGMVVTEAFARGLPVITTPRAGASDLLKPMQNGLLVAPADARALADTIMWCLDNREALAAMRQPALDAARSWQWSDYRRALRAAVDGQPFETPAGRSAILTNASK